MSQKKHIASPCNLSVTRRETIEQTVGREVLARRKSVNLTQAELSELALVSRKTLNEVEGGLKKEIRLRTVMRLSRALNCTPNELLGYLPPRVRRGAGTE